MRAAWSGADIQIALVTDWGELFVTRKELEDAGAVFSTRGAPLNREAKMLMELAHYVTLDGWMEREHIHV